jgi:hypothetical protein
VTIPRSCRQGASDPTDHRADCGADTRHDAADHGARDRSACSADNGVGVVVFVAGHSRNVSGVVGPATEPWVSLVMI